MLTPDTVVIRNKAVLSAGVGSEIVLLHLGNNAYYDSDAIGADIWQRLDERIAIKDLCRDLSERYRVEPDVCREDVLAFLEDALREGLVIVDPPSTSSR